MVCGILGHPITFAFAVQHLADPPYNEVSLLDIAPHLDRLHATAACSCGSRVSREAVWRVDLPTVLDIDATLEEFEAQPSQRVTAVLQDLYSDSELNKEPRKRVHLLFGVDPQLSGTCWYKATLLEG